MDIRFAPELEARILQSADYYGIPAEQFVSQAVLRLIEEDERFRADIDEALEQAERGQLIGHGEVKARITESLQSR